MTDDGTATFEAHRPHLFRLAYRMTGCVGEAEDAVQEAWVRWSRTDPTTVRHPRAWLTQTTTRLCLDHLGSARARREAYVGPWLPEPLVDRDAPADEAVALADDVSVALLLALERLSPLERAAFLLHDVFDVDHTEVAATLGRSEAACRQLASRARAHVRAARPRQPADRATHARVVAAFGAAVASGDVDALRAVLTDDAVLLSDGGGRAAAARVPVLGGDKVARFLLGVAKAFPLADSVRVEVASVHGAPGFVLYDGGRALQTFAFAFADDRIAGVYTVRNPEKLGHLASI